MIRNVHPGSWIQISIDPSRIIYPGVKMHRIPDPDPQHWLGASPVA